VINPRSASKMLLCLGLGAIAIGAILDRTRLQTVAYQTGNSSIATLRSSQCRLLGSNDKLTLGGTYYQPRGLNQTGTLLGEGVILCDSTGGTAITDRNSVAQFLKSGDPLAMNKTINDRIADPNNPDHTNGLRVQRAINIPIYREPTANTNTGLFQ
jgi:hypothetical protein